MVVGGSILHYVHMLLGGSGIIRRGNDSYDWIFCRSSICGYVDLHYYKQRILLIQEHILYTSHAHFVK
jgi:hypothetical protein